MQSLVATKVNRYCLNNKRVDSMEMEMVVEDVNSAEPSKPRVHEFSRGAAESFDSTGRRANQRSEGLERWIYKYKIRDGKRS